MADVIQKIQFKRGIKTVLESVLTGSNKPLVGEPVYETDTGKLKIGDGIKNYVDLPYLTNSGTEEQIIFSTHYEFPAIGEENKLYIAKEETNAYIWTGSKYKIVSVDSREIDGGGANAVFD